MKQTKKVISVILLIIITTIFCVPSFGVTKENSGSKWCSRYPVNKSQDDLSNDHSFRDNVKKFIAALKNAGVTVTVSETLRSPERVYLMHYAWEIAKGNIKPEKVPEYPGVNIEWNHSTGIQAAKDMVSGFNLAARPILKSKHTSGLAIDMTISWSASKTKPLYIIDGNGKKITITVSKSTGTDPGPTLMSIGESYGVKHLVGDKPHWSYDGL